MKKIILYFILILYSFTLMQSCKKDSVTNTEAELLIQKWTWVSETRSIQAYPLGNSRQVFSNDTYSDFRTDSKVYNYLYNLYDTSFYSLKSNMLSLVLIQNGQKTDSTNATILTLNTNSLVLSFPNIYYVMNDSTGIETIYTGVVIDSLRR